MFKQIVIGSVFALCAVCAAAPLAAQNPAPAALAASPHGASQLQVAYTGTKVSEMYKSGKWVEITYGRPLLRGRKNIFGSGATYGRDLNAGAPIWRAGADQTTRLRTEVPLVIAGKTVPAGEYSVFIDLKDGAWTFVLSNWAAQQVDDPKNKTALWGSYEYTPDKDVLRAPMTLSKTAASVEQLTWSFINASAGGATLVISWDTQSAAIPFTVAK